MNPSADHHADRIRRNMELTMENIVSTQNYIAASPDAKLNARLRMKNERRLQALEDMRRAASSHSPKAPPNLF